MPEEVDPEEEKEEEVPGTKTPAVDPTEEVEIETPGFEAEEVEDPAIEPPAFNNRRLLAEKPMPNKKH